MTKYEYKWERFDIPKDDQKALAIHLNDFGDEGWRVIKYIETGIEHFTIKTGETIETIEVLLEKEIEGEQ